MNRSDLAKRARSYTRDLASAVFRAVDVNDYINEAIDRCKEVIPEFKGMVYLITDNDTPTHLPSEHHYLLSVFCASRCFFQDERDYKAATMMNEFEVKLSNLAEKIMNGEITIVDGDGVEVDISFIADHVQNVYFNGRDYVGKRSTLTDIDEGVEGVE